MANWIAYPTSFHGQTVSLITMEEEHFPALVKLAKETAIWKFYTYDGTNPEALLNNCRAALAEREKGTRFPFVIIHKDHNTIIGSRGFLDIQPKNKKLEIGGTWLHPHYWATAVNLECKLLLLTYCFEKLDAWRVQLKTDENNIRSRKAIEKIGGRFEGILQNDMVRDDYTKRNSAYYSIIESEWVDKKMKLKTLFDRKLKESGD